MRRDAALATLNRRPIVAGQKGKGSGGSQHTPVEAPNTLQSTALARVIDLVSEGEIQGLANGLQGVFFDNTPLQNADGSFNFRNALIDGRTGLPDQDPFTGFSAVEAETAVGAQVVLQIPLVRAVSNVNATSVRVTIRVPSLQNVDTGTGDINPASVAIGIDVQPSGGAYVTMVVDTIQGKTVSAYQRAYRMVLSGAGPWNIRVRRLTPDSTSSSLQNDTFWDSFTTITDYQLKYPNSAMIAMTVDAQSFGGRIPRRQYLIQGLKTEIPSNYNPLTRAYTGVWNGTFTTAWHNNPAWVLYACIANKRWGLGDYVPVAFRDKWTLYSIGQYCDALVPDGMGGQEPRYTFNAVLGTAEDAFKVLQSIAATFRGMIYWGSAGVTATADRDLDPVKLVTPSNVIGGTINWSGAGLKTRHTVVNVTWYDPSDFYRPNIEMVEGNPSDIARFGWRVASIVAYGCTSRGQAHRAGLWYLETESSEATAINWQAALDHADVYPGEIVEIQDPAYAGVEFGGRVKAYPNAASIKLDRQITIEAGKSYSIQLTLDDGSVVSRTVTTGASTTDTLALSVPLPLDAFAPTDLFAYPDAFGFGGGAFPLVGVIWILTSSAVSPLKAKILARRESNGVFDISAVFHDPTKYARIEQGIVLEAPSYTALPIGPIAAPTNIGFSEGLTLAGGGQVRSKVTLSWTASKDPRVVTYEVQARPPGQNWQPYGETSSVSFDLLDLTGGSWGLRVRGIDGLGRTSPWLTNESAVLAGLLVAPAAVTALRTVFRDSRQQLEWLEIKDYRTVRYEIRQGTTFDGALRLGDVAHPPFIVYGDGQYWVASYIGPTAGPRVYSPPASIVVTGAILQTNVTATYNELAEGWTGTFTGSVGLNLPNIRTGGGGDILSQPDFLNIADLLNLGQGSGTYVSPHIVNVGRAATCLVGVIYGGTGSPVGQNILTVNDFLGMTDVLGATSAQFVDVYPIIRTGVDTTDAFTPTDIFDLPDAFAPFVWSAWGRFAPGWYSAGHYQMGMALDTFNAQTTAFCQAFKWWVDPPARIDHRTSLAVGAGGLAITYRPDGATVDAAFNGGPNGAVTPNVQITVRNASSGDTPTITAPTLAGCTITVLNGGVGVARTVDASIIGF